MGDNGKDEVKKEEPIAQQPPEFTWTLKFKPPNFVEISGPIAYEAFTIFALDRAKDIVKTWNIQQAQSKIIPAKHGIIDFMRRK